MKRLHIFLEKVKDDGRVGPTHICLYVVLLTMLTEQEFMRISRDEVMQRTKILGRNTFYRAMRLLDQLGFIEYRPGNGRGKVGVRVKLCRHEVPTKHKGQLLNIGRKMRLPINRKQRKPA